MPRNEESMDEWFGDDGELKLDEVPDLTIPALGQIPPSVPIQWATLEAEGKSKPFATPGEEFIRSVFPLTMSVLAYRWKGIYKPEELESLSQEQKWKQKRFEYQDKVIDDSLQKAMSSDVDLQARIVNRDIINFSNILETLQADFSAGEEYQKSRNGGPFGYVKMPMTVDSKSKLANAAVAVSNLLATRIGLATKIIEDNVNVKVDVKSEMRAYLATEDPEYEELKKLANMSKRVFESDRITALEQGVPVYDTIAEEIK